MSALKRFTQLRPWLGERLYLDLKSEATRCRCNMSEIVRRALEYYFLALDVDRIDKESSSGRSSNNLLQYGQEQAKDSKRESAEVAIFLKQQGQSQR